MGNEIPFDEGQLRRTLEANDFNVTHTAKHLGCRRGTVSKYRDLWEITPEPFRVEPIPSKRQPVEDLIEERKNKQKYRFDYEKKIKLIQVSIRIPGPIGILITGDPHVDDDGTDLITMEQHARICRENDFVLPFCIGDVTNAWIGGLARLYGDQSTSAPEAVQLLEWFVKSFGDWLGFIGGNHDGWLGPGNPIPWLMGEKSGPYIEDAMRFQMNFPNQDFVRVNARHQWPGKSMYNVAHGEVRAFRENARDHIIVGGHWHECGYTPLKDVSSGRICHALQVGSYKVYDRFAREKGFKDSHLSPCAFITINVELPESHPDKIKIWWDAEEGLDYLKFLRER